MADTHVVSIEDLRRRLGDTLGRDTLLGRRLDTALRRQDERQIAAALDALRLYPDSVRARVEEVLTGWLLDGTGTVEEADLASA
jgi:hypothetical protein